MTLPVASNTISLSQANTELGRSSTATLTMNDAALRTLAGVGDSGTSWSMSSLWGKSSITISNALNPTAQASAANSISAYIYFNSDGSITYFDPDLSYGSTNWATPTTAGIGSSYWIKVTRISGITTSGMVSGTIYSLSSSRSIFITTAFRGQTRLAYGSIDIYSDAGGTTRVGGGNYDMNATWEY